MRPPRGRRLNPGGPRHRPLPPVPRRQPPQGPAAGRADAAAHPRGVRRPGALPRPRQAAAAHAPGRPAQLADLLRPARHRQDRPGPRHRPPHPGRVSCRSTPSPSGIKEVRDVLEEARAELEDTGRRTILFVDETAPLQQRPAGRAAAGRRGGPRHPDRGDDAEPVLRHQLAAAEPQPDLHLRAADARADQDAAASVPWPTASAAWANTTSA